jgi:cardiolipin synthase (CMP-forming)
MSSRIITLPNLLTVFRMALIPVFVSLLFYQKFLLALGIFIVAGITDGLDGLLARRFHQQSPLGRILDPIADKMMLVTSFVVLSMRGVYPIPIPKHLPIPFWVTITVISRDVFILVGAAAINMVTGFRAFQPSLPGKVSTVVQIVAVATVMLAAQIHVGTGYYLPTVYASVFALTLLSGVHYIFFVSRLLNEDRR